LVVWCFFFSAGCLTSRCLTPGLEASLGPERIFRCENAAIHYHERGEGRPLVLLHGLGGSAYSWRYVADYFAKSYRVITIDLKGFGSSDKPPDQAYSPLDHGRIISRFIREKGLTGVVLVGNSLGGIVALVTYMELAAGSAHPVQALILLNAPAYDQRIPFYIKMMRIPVLNRLALGVIPKQFLVRQVLKIAYGDPARVPEESIRAYACYRRLPGATQAIIQTARQLVPDNVDELTPKYKEMDLPVLVLWGEADRIVLPAVGRRLAADLPRARFAAIPGCGHMPQEECPAETIRLMAEFLGDEKKKLP
jgi:pimeloyl-ACP methyl ester carboxylesterase